jgi:hypothetical protein
MKLSTAINKAPRIYASVALGAGVMGSVKLSKAVARDLVSDWLDKEDFDGNLEFVDDQDYTVAVFYEDEGELYIGS